MKNKQIETTTYHSILRRFFIKKSYKKQFFNLLKLNRCLRFLDIYKTNLKNCFFSNVQNLKYTFINHKYRILFRYLRFFHFMYYLKFKKIFGFEKSNNTKKLYSNTIIKILKKNIFLLY